MVDIVQRRVAPIVRDWQEHGSAYEIARLLTAPARRGLVLLEVEHPENLPTEGPAIVVANHLSFFDSVLLLFALPRPVSMLGKAEYTDRRITKWLFCGAGMIPIRRESPGDLGHAFALVGEVLGRGEVVGLFPEGTRSRDGLLHRGHSRCRSPRAHYGCSHRAARHHRYRSDPASRSPIGAPIPARHPQTR